MSRFDQDITELKSRGKIWLASFVISSLFFLAFPADPMKTDYLGFYKPVVSLLLDRIRTYLLPSNVQLLPGSVGGPITIYTVASLFFGFLVSLPILLYEVYRFIEPAFENFPNRIAVVSYILFICGAGFGFFILCPAIIYGLFAFFPYVGVTANFVSAQDFYSMVLWTTLISGFCFLTPIMIYILAKLGADVSAVRRKRWYMWGVVYIVSAVVTPDSNIIADFVLFIPLIAMIEISLLIAEKTSKQKESGAEKDHGNKDHSKRKFPGSIARARPKSPRVVVSTERRAIVTAHPFYPTIEIKTKKLIDYD